MVETPGKRLGSGLDHVPGADSDGQRPSQSTDDGEGEELERKKKERKKKREGGRGVRWGRRGGGGGGGGAKAVKGVFWSFFFGGRGRGRGRGRGGGGGKRGKTYVHGQHLEAFLASTHDCVFCSVSK